MNNIERDFCNRCDNKLKISCEKNDSSKYPLLLTICETCNEVKSYKLEDIEDKRLSYIPYEINTAINIYGNIIDDNTISYAINKKCSKCNNTKIKQVCTNVNNMKYIFICTGCEEQWSIND